MNHSNHKNSSKHNNCKINQSANNSITIVSLNSSKPPCAGLSNETKSVLPESLKFLVENSGSSLLVNNCQNNNKVSANCS